MNIGVFSLRELAGVETVGGEEEFAIVKNALREYLSIY